MNIPTISPQHLFDTLQREPSLELIDVRTPAEFRTMHVARARNLPLDELDPAAEHAANGHARYVICQTGGRARQACEKFIASGLEDVVCVDGGTQAWEAAGLPLVYGRKTISLERQVRIAAGTIVLLGVALGIFLHLGFLAIAAFVGAGLVFAGITDSCGMAMLLAKMPWNRRLLDDEQG